MLALLERNARKVGLSKNLGEDPVREDRQELVGIERHWSILSDRLYWVVAACSWRDFSRKKKTGQVRRVGRSRKRESGLQVPRSLMGRGREVSGSGRVGWLLTTDKPRCLHW